MVVQKGKVLKVKTGYNPNSSSIGTHINMFLLGSAAIATFMGTLIVAINAFKEERVEENKLKNSLKEKV